MGKETNLHRVWSFKTHWLHK